jgi:hypothetical protein
MTLSATLAQRPDAERIRLRLGSEFITHRDDLWRRGEAEARRRLPARTGMMRSAVKEQGRERARFPLAL